MPASLTHKLLFWVVLDVLGTVLVAFGIYKIVRVNTNLLPGVSHWVFIMVGGGLILLAMLQIIRLRLAMNRSTHTDT